MIRLIIIKLQMEVGDNIQIQHRKYLNNHWNQEAKKHKLIDIAIRPQI